MCFTNVSSGLLYGRVTYCLRIHFTRKITLQNKRIIVNLAAVFSYVQLGEKILAGNSPHFDASEHGNYGEIN